MSARASSSLHNWAEILCCFNCSQLFSRERLPINLSCGVVCLPCIQNPSKIKNDKIKLPRDVDGYPINLAFLQILSVNCADLDQLTLAGRLEVPHACDVENMVIELSNYLSLVKTERGGAISSDCLSRLVQRRVVSILSAQLIVEDGRENVLKLVKSIAERIVTEVVLSLQSPGHLSSYLWSAVRSRGCQFLGPAMQEDVLRLILLALVKGELIARKTLVLYIVQTMSNDYPHVSKTCVGHVVQLLYRASCFNVIKRDGESSLMQLKPEFRNYDRLRREHDSQIIQIALEAGLRISADQWSSLLYGDNTHRSYIDSIIDTLQLSPSLLTQTITELRALLGRNGDPNNMTEILPTIEKIFQSDDNLSADFSTTRQSLSSLKLIMDYYSKFFKSKNNIRKPESKHSMPVNGQHLYKTRLCRDVLNGQACPRGESCSYAHSSYELRPSNAKVPEMISEQQLQQPPPILSMNGNKMMPFGDMSNAFPPQMAPNADGPSMQAIQPMVPMVPMMIPQQAPTVAEMPMDQVGMFRQAQIRPICMLSPNGDTIQPPQAPVLLPPCQTNANTLYFPIVAAPPMTMNQQQAMQAIITTVNPQLAPNILPTPIGQPLNNSTVFATVPPPSNTQSIWFNEDLNDGLTNMRKLSYNHRMSNGSNGSTPQLNGYNANGHKFSNSSEWDGSFGNQQSLNARRQEIVSRLSQMRVDPSSLHHTDDEDELTSHVSYTVASSVLFEDLESCPGAIELPPFPPPNCASLVGISSEIQPHQLRNSGLSETPPKNNLLNNMQIPSTISQQMWSSVRTACPTTFFHSRNMKPVTVQSGSHMNVKDMFERPLVISSIQTQNLSPQASMEMVDPFNFHVPQVIKPLPLKTNPQNIVSSTLDSILTVKERINNVNMKGGGLGSAVEKAQLNVELNIVNQQISKLDQQTKQSCLLKELEAVEKRIEDLNVSA